MKLPGRAERETDVIELLRPVVTSEHPEADTGSAPGAVQWSAGQAAAGLTRESPARPEATSGPAVEPGPDPAPSGRTLERVATDHEESLRQLAGQWQANAQRAIDQWGHQLEETWAGRVIELQRLLGERMSALRAACDELRELEESARTRAQELDRVVGEGTAALQRAGAEHQQAIARAAAPLVEEVVRADESVRDQLANLDTLGGQFADRTEAALGALDRGATDARASVDGAAARRIAEVEAMGDELAESTTQYISQLVRAADERRELLDGTARGGVDFVEAACERARQLEKTTSERMARFEEMAGAAAAGLHDVVTEARTVHGLAAAEVQRAQTAVEDLAPQVAARVAEIDDAATGAIGRVETASEDARQGVLRVSDEQRDEAERAATRRESSFDERVEARGTEAEATIDALIDKRIAAYEKIVAERLAAVERTTEERRKQLDDAWAVRLGEVDGIVQERVTALEALSERVQSLEQGVTARVQQMDRTVEERLSSITEALSLARLLRRDVADRLTGTEARAVELDHRVEERMLELDRTLERWPLGAGAASSDDEPSSVAAEDVSSNGKPS